jgi:creatinine amidohydrolase
LSTRLKTGRAWLALWLAASCTAANAVAPDTPHIEELTWTELRDQLQAGTTTVLVPIGGTEQNGPHMVLGKHNIRVRVLAGLIAQRVGSTVVAPVMAYVPEGSINPPMAHMRFTGTLSISDGTFEAVLESTARSLCQHGFKNVVFLGDHGGYQKNLERVAVKLKTGLGACKVHALHDYYRAAQADYAEILEKKGFSAAEIGTHAGLSDTALSLAVAPASVRDTVAKTAVPQVNDGVYGDPRRATAELGQLGVDRVIKASAKALRALLESR